LNPQLATWVSKQRQFHSSSSRNPHTQKYLTDEKVTLLEAIGFVWNVTDAAPKVVESRTRSEIDGIWDEVKKLHEEGMFWECEMILNLQQNVDEMIILLMFVMKLFHQVQKFSQSLSFMIAVLIHGIKFTDYYFMQQDNQDLL